MAAIFNPAAHFDFSKEEIRALSELAQETFLKSESFTAFHTIYPNIKMDKQVGFIGKASKAGVARQGCDPTSQTMTVGSRVLEWTPSDWEIRLDECYDVLKSTCAIYALKQGVSQADLTSTEYMAIVTQKVNEAMLEMAWRFAWFGDVDAANIADGGTLTAGANPDFFTVVDGYWKQMATQVTANATQLVAISENAGNSYANQALPTTNIQTYLKNLVYKANINLRKMANLRIFCTQSFYDAYEQSLTGTAIESMYANLVDGQAVLKFNGIPLVAMPMWDLEIKESYDTGVVLLKPHRAVLTTKEILGIGVDSTEELGDMNLWYEKKDRKVYIEAMGTIDAKLMNPEFFQLAW